MSNSKKMPKWVLLEQLHIDVNIKSDMPAKERRELVQLINSETLQRFFRYMIEGPHKNSVRVEITK